MSKKIPLFIFLSLIFIVLYLVFAGRPLNKEYHFNPEWKINVTNPIVSQSVAGDTKLSFKLGKNIGYFTVDGKITGYLQSSDKTSISEKYYATYTQQANETVFYSNDGKEKGTILSSGYPYFTGDNIYVMLGGGASFSKCNDTGMPEWTYYGSVPITAFAGKKDFTAVGFVDGSIKLFDNTNGQTAIEFSPGGSDYSVIYGLDITENGEYIGCVCGLDRQRFVLAKKESTQTKILFHTFISNPMTTNSVVYWTQDQTKVLYNSMNTVGIYDMVSDTHTVIPVQHRIIDVAETDTLIFLLGKNGHDYSVDVIEKTNTLVGHFDFTAESAFIKTYDNALFLGRDSNISKIQVSRK